MKTQQLQRIFQIRHWIIRQQDHGILIDVLGQQLRVEVVLMQV